MTVIRSIAVGPFERTSLGDISLVKWRATTIYKRVGILRKLDLFKGRLRIKAIGWRIWAS